MRPAAQGTWSTGLCECCADPGGCGTCCYAWCCPCCQYGQNVERMPDGDVCCGGSCCGSCCCYFIMLELGCCCFLHMNARGWIRRKYNIPGDCCQDCMTTLCCAACAMCQEHRELTIRLVQRGGKVLPTPSNKVQPLDGDEKTATQPQPAPVYIAPAPLQPPPPAQTMQATVPPYTAQPYGAASAPPMPQQYQPPPGYQAMPTVQQPPYPPAPYPSAPYMQPPQPYMQPPQPYGDPTYIQPLPSKKSGKKAHHHHRRSRSGSSSDD